jgi:glutamyl-tRNA synthetase/glutamyl-Q tRNA(Asp) synthetase
LEDHDRGRCRPAYEAALLEDLEWLGLTPHLGAIAGFRRGPNSYRQSDSADRYTAALDRLSRVTHVYACECSRKDIAAEGGDGTSRETPYSGRCRGRALPFDGGRGVRVRIDPGQETFEDARLGELTQSPAQQCGDVLLRDRLGNWTYQFTVVVDDMDHGVDLVIRGEDLLASTGRQLRLARLLGRVSAPVFLHHPLIYRDNGA